MHINPVTIVQKGNTLLQVLLNELAAKLGKPGQIELKPERIAAFHLPCGFRGKMDELMELLSILSSPVAPDFYMKEMASRSIKTPYEVKTHIYNHKVALASYQDPWVECKTNLSRGSPGILSYPPQSTI